MIGFCVVCGGKGEVSKRGKCSICSKNAMQDNQKRTVIKMVIRIRSVK